MSGYIISMINDLMEDREARESNRQSCDQLIAKCEAEIKKVCPELYAELESLRNNTKIIDDQWAKSIAKLEDQIKSETLKNGASVDGTLANPKGKTLRAIYTSGNESIDMAAFRGYALNHPEAKELIKKGNPSVKLQEVNVK